MADYLDRFDPEPSPRRYHRGYLDMLFDGDYDTENLHDSNGRSPRAAVTIEELDRICDTLLDDDPAEIPY